MPRVILDHFVECGHDESHIEDTDMKGKLGWWKQIIKTHTRREPSPTRVARKLTSGFCRSCDSQGKTVWKKKLDGDHSIKKEAVHFPRAHESTEYETERQRQELTLNSSIVLARQKARDAARLYGWTEATHSMEDLSPKLVREFLNISGNSPGSLPDSPPEHGTLSVTSPIYDEPISEDHSTSRIYQDPGIDWDRWNAMPQSKDGRGRYPVPSPPPEQPLPLAALRVRGKQLRDSRALLADSVDAANQIRRNRLARKQRIDSIAPLRMKATPLEPEDCSKQPREYWPKDPFYLHYRPESPPLSPLSRPALRSMASEIEMEIDETMEMWRNAGS
jgi:hypothetical protein